MAEARWKYVAETRDGGSVRGYHDGPDETAIAARLRSDGLRPVSIRRERGGLGKGAGAPIPERVYARLVRGLADLVQAGIPVRDALAALARRERHARAAAFLSRLGERLDAGSGLAAAIAEDPARPPRLLAAMIAAGEATGQLGTVLDRLATQMEAGQALRSELSGQMIYPLAVLGLITLTLVFLSYVVLPQFEVLFRNAGAEPPRETALVFAAGAGLRTFGVWIALALLAGLLLGRRLAERLPGLGDRLIEPLPVIGQARRKLDAARYGRALGLLLESGQPLSRAEPVARSLVASPLRRAALARAGGRIRDGQALAPALGAEKALPEEMIAFVELGEKTGRLGALLERGAELHEAEARRLLKRSVELLGPAMVAILGLFVAAVIASVMSGVLSLNEVVY